MVLGLEELVDDELMVCLGQVLEVGHHQVQQVVVHSEQVVFLAREQLGLQLSGNSKELEEELRKRLEGVLVEAVGEKEQNVLEQLQEVEGVKWLSEALFLIHLGHDSVNGLHSNLALNMGVVLKGPKHAVDEDFERLFWDVEEKLEAVLHHTLNENEEVFSGLYEGNEVSGDHRNSGLENDRNHLRK